MPCLPAAFQFGYVMGLVECKNTWMAFITCALTELTLITYFKLMWSGPQKYLDTFVQIKCVIFTNNFLNFQPYIYIYKKKLVKYFPWKVFVTFIYNKCHLVWYSDTCNDIQRVLIWLKCPHFLATVYIFVCSKGIIKIIINKWLIVKIWQSNSIKLNN